MTIDTSHRPTPKKRERVDASAAKAVPRIKTQAKDLDDFCLRNPELFGSILQAFRPNLGEQLSNATGTTLEPPKTVSDFCSGLYWCLVGFFQQIVGTDALLNTYGTNTSRAYIESPALEYLRFFLFENTCTDTEARLITGLNSSPTRGLEDWGRHANSVCRSLIKLCNAAQKEQQRSQSNDRRTAETQQRPPPPQQPTAAPITTPLDTINSWLASKQLPAVSAESRAATIFIAEHRGSIVPTLETRFNAMSNTAGRRTPANESYYPAGLVGNLLASKKHWATIVEYIKRGSRRTNIT